MLRIGGGLALPVAQLDEDDAAQAAAEAVALIGSSVIRGLWDMWLWTPDRLTIVAPSFRIDSTRGDFVWAAEAALGMMIYTGDEEGDDVETEIPFQVAGELGGRLSRSVVVGGRLQLWWLTTGEEDEDDAQLAMEPFVRFEGENAFGYAGLTMNLDDPLGFAFDDDGYWGLRFGGGARF